MAEFPGDGNVYIPRRYLRRTRFGAGAFAGSVVPSSTPTADMRTSDPDSGGPLRPFPVTPVNVTSFSAGNRWRAFVQPIMLEWWNWRHTMRGDIYVRDPEQMTRIVRRSQARVRQ